VQPVAAACKPIYLTLDTGHMAVAPLMAEILNKHQVKVTFFAANERTQEGDGSLGAHWAPWWKARAAEGHEFASHTWDHVYWRGDVPAAPGAQQQFKMRPSAGPLEGKDFTWSARSIAKKSASPPNGWKPSRARRRCRSSGRRAARPRLPCWRRPSRAAMSMWAGRPRAFLGDELASEKYPNDFLLKKALRDVRSGDILLAHLGIWSRKDPWAPKVLEPLITGLQARGFCFQTLREHPQYKAWIDAQAGSAPAKPAK
jgi:peptidoglycan/xylan/chitin deacetylase (PgdA/CDA1 family)